MTGSKLPSLATSLILENSRPRTPGPVAVLQAVGLLPASPENTGIFPGVVVAAGKDRWGRRGRVLGI